MKKFVLLCLIILFSLSGCQKQATERTDIKINFPKDNSVNGYRLNEENMPNTISKNEVSVSSNKNNNYNDTDNNNTDSVNLCGNKNSKIYHKSSCSSAKKMLDSNKVYFKSVFEFQENGYKPCKRCNP